MCGFVCNYYKLNVDSSRENGKEKPFFNETFFNFNIWSHQSNIFGYNLDYVSSNSVYMQEVGGKIDLLMRRNAFLNDPGSILKFIGI